MSYGKTESQFHWQHYLLYFLPKKWGRGGLRPGRPKGVYQACGTIRQACHGEHTQSWDHKGKGCWELRALGQLPHTISLASHTPLHDSHTHTHIHAQSCTLPWLISHNINDQPNCGYTHTIQSYSHAKHLRGQTPNLTVLKTKSHDFVFKVEEFQWAHTQASLQSSYQYGT